MAREAFLRKLPVASFSIHPLRFQLHITFFNGVRTPLRVKNLPEIYGKTLAATRQSNYRSYRGEIQNLH